MVFSPGILSLSTHPPILPALDDRQVPSCSTAEDHDADTPLTCQPIPPAWSRIRKTRARHRATGHPEARARHCSCQLVDPVTPDQSPSPQHRRPPASISRPILANDLSTANHIYGANSSADLVDRFPPSGPVWESRPAQLDQLKLTSSTAHLGRPDLPVCPQITTSTVPPLLYNPGHGLSKR